MYIPSKI